MLAPGDVLVVPADGYPAVRTIALEQLRSRGVEVRVVATDEAAISAALPGATLAWIETPSNPGLAVLDVAALAAAAHAEGALLAVDNTLATPLLQRPLELGADLSIASASKGSYRPQRPGARLRRGGRSRRAAQARAWRSLTGAIAGPFEAWLAHRSLATLDVRHERQCANALALAAGAGRARRRRATCAIPACPPHPGHALAARSFGGERFGSVVCFDLETEARAQAFLAACGSDRRGDELRRRALLRRAAPALGHGRRIAGFIRLSAGIEDAADLVADVCAALDAAR